MYRHGCQELLGLLEDCQGSFIELPEVHIIREIPEEGLVFLQYCYSTSSRSTLSAGAGPRLFEAKSPPVQTSGNSARLTLVGLLCLSHLGLPLRAGCRNMSRRVAGTRALLRKTNLTAKKSNT